MILFNIIQSDDKKAEEISTFLINQHYALHTHVDVNSILTLDSKKQTIRLFFITKALLYSTIEKDVKAHFLSDDLVIYATPVSHINEEFAELLRMKIKSV